MNVIEQFSSFLNTLATPKRAIQLLMAVIGVILALIIFFPRLNLILEPSLGDSLKEYKLYTFIISGVLGCFIGLVLFSSLEYLWQKISTYFQTRKINKDNIKEETRSRQAINNQLIENFRIAHPYLDADKKDIIRRLVIVDNESYSSESTHCNYLEQQGWITFLTSSSEHNNIFKINPLLKQLADDLWNQEVEDNTQKFMTGDSELLQHIINPLSDINLKKEIPEYLLRYNKKIIEDCFNIKKISEDVIIISFKERYRENFETHVNKNLRTDSLFVIDQHAVPF